MTTIWARSVPNPNVSTQAAANRLIRPDVLISDSEFEISGLPRDAGPIRGRAVTIRVLESGVWKIAAERNASRTPVRK